MSQYNDRSREAMMLLRGTEVFFLGFRGDLGSLLHHGWEIQVDNDIRTYNYRVALVNKEFGLAGMMPADVMMESHRKAIYMGPMMGRESRMTFMGEQPVFRTIKPYLRDGIESYALNYHELRMVDLFQMDSELDIQQIVVGPKDIQGILDQIIVVQRPAQKEFRLEKAKGVKKIEAQIITLNDYMVSK